MSDLFYRQAVTEDGEPVPVTEELWKANGMHYPHPTSDHTEEYLVCPCSWAVILPGDTVLIGESDDAWTAWSVSCDYAPVITCHKPGDACVAIPADLTLVCGPPEDNPHRFGDNTNPAWRWDR